MTTIKYVGTCIMRMLHFKAPLRRQQTQDKAGEEQGDQQDTDEPITGACSQDEADTGQSEEELVSCEGTGSATPCTPLSTLDEPFLTIDEECELSTDVWVVVEDFTASNAQELSVTRGQQVELVDASAISSTDWCLVRSLVTETHTTSQEGLVPMAALKQVPNLKVSGSHTSIENEDVAGGGAASGEPSPNTSNFSLASNSTASSSSPANKRRTSFRKWLTNPVRKLSQSRLDKQSLEKSMAESNKPLKDRDKKKFFNKRSKEEQPPLAQPEDLAEEEQLETTSEAGTVTPEIPAGAQTGIAGDEEDSEAIPAMPPKMELIDSPLQQPGGSRDNISTLSLKPDPNVTSSDLKTAIENFVKNRNTTPDSPTATPPEGGTEAEDAEAEQPPVTETKKKKVPTATLR